MATSVLLCGGELSILEHQFAFKKISKGPQFHSAPHYIDCLSKLSFPSSHSFQQLMPYSSCLHHAWPLERPHTSPVDLEAWHRSAAGTQGHGKGWKRLCPWGTYRLSEFTEMYHGRYIHWAELSLALTLISANATHHKFRAVPGVQQSHLLHSLCKQMQSRLWCAYVTSSIQAATWMPTWTKLHLFSFPIPEVLGCRVWKPGRESNLSPPWLSWTYTFCVMQSTLPTEHTWWALWGTWGKSVSE